MKFVIKDLKKSVSNALGVDENAITVELSTSIAFTGKKNLVQLAASIQNGSYYRNKVCGYGDKVLSMKLKLAGNTILFANCGLDLAQIQADGQPLIAHASAINYELPCPVESLIRLGIDGTYESRIIIDKKVDDCYFDVRYKDVEHLLGSSQFYRRKLGKAIAEASNVHFLSPITNEEKEEE